MEKRFASWKSGETREGGPREKLSYLRRLKRLNRTSARTSTRPLGVLERLNDLKRQEQGAKNYHYPNLEKNREKDKSLRKGAGKVLIEFCERPLGNLKPRRRSVAHQRWGKNEMRRREGPSCRGGNRGKIKRKDSTKTGCRNPTNQTKTKEES